MQFFSLSLSLSTNNYFFLILHENVICCEYALEAPHRVASNEYPHLFNESLYTFMGDNSAEMFLHPFWKVFFFKRK